MAPRHQVMGYLDDESLRSAALACKTFLYTSSLPQTDVQIHKLSPGLAGNLEQESCAADALTNEVSHPSISAVLCGTVVSRQKRGKHLTFVHLEPRNGVRLQLVLVSGQYQGDSDIEGIDPDIKAEHRGKEFRMFCNLFVPGSIVWCTGVYDTQRSKVDCFSVNAHRVELVRSHHEPASIVRSLEYVRDGTFSLSRAALALLCTQQQVSHLLQLLMGKTVPEGDDAQPPSRKKLKKEAKRQNKGEVIFLGRTNAVALKQEVLKVSRSLQGLDTRRARVRPPRIPKNELAMLETVRDRAYLWTIESTGLGNTSCGTAGDGPLSTSEQLEFGSLDPKHNIPIPEDQLRQQWLELKKKPQLQWMLTQIKSMVNTMEESGRCVRNVIDVGGGRGDLALLVAKHLPKAQVTVYDVNESSLMAGQARAVEEQLTNIKFELADIGKVEMHFCDLAMGLHACGGLSDAITNLAVRCQSSFIVCTCCFGKNEHLVSSGAAPGSETWLDSEVFPDTQHRSVVTRLAETMDQPVSQRAMHLINSLRLSCISKYQNQQAQTLMDVRLKSFSGEWSPKNQVLFGLCLTRSSGKSC